MSIEFEKLTWNKKLEILRTLKGWTQREAAEKCNTNQKVYWNWESGESYPRGNSRRAICRAFGIKEEEIFSKNVDKVVC